METVFINSPLGITKITGDDQGIMEISIREHDASVSASVPASLIDAAVQLQEYFDGTRTSFTFAINPQGTDFQKRVWTELLTIPFGKTASYMEITKKLGDVKAIRAVAAANGKNPLWIVVPCHRIIGTDGSLTGYAGGLWRKKWLLEHENPSAQQSLF